MHFELVLPGLAWPPSGAAQAAGGLALPALAALLGHAEVSWLPPVAPEVWLTQRFGARDPRQPYAALRRRGEAPPADDAHWLCCDPVHLHFARDKLLLADASGLAIRADEAATLIAGINETFSDIGRFEAPAPDRWYVALADEPRPFFHPLPDVNGRPVQLFLPEGEDVARWARLANELEVWLYNHPVNAAREAAGQRPINGIWLWGAGPRQATLTAPAARIQADGPLARGLARHAGIEPEAADRYQHGSGFAVVERLHRPALHFDEPAWQAAVTALERDWFAPLLAALKSKQIRQLTISAPGDKHCLQLEIAAGDLWRFWRKPRPLASLLGAAPQTSGPTP